jgi:hypothetical protein
MGVAQHSRMRLGELLCVGKWWWTLTGAGSRMTSGLRSRPSVVPDTRTRTHDVASGSGVSRSPSEVTCR